MTLNAAKVLVGTADQQSTTGAVRSGAPLETVPSTFAAAETALNAMTASGYVSENGLTLSNGISTSDIKEWNRSTVRKLIESYDGTLAWSLIQQDYESWCQAVGSDHVTKVNATSGSAGHGEQLHIGLGSHLGPEQAWGFAMKDGDARIIILVPRGQVTSLDSLTFNATSAISLPCTLSAYDDGTGTGDSIHIYIDDGVKASA